MHLTKFSSLFKFLLKPQPKKLKPLYNKYEILSSLKIFLLAIIVTGIINIFSYFFLGNIVTNRWTDFLYHGEFRRDSGNELILFLIITFLTPLFNELSFRLFLTKFNLSFTIISISLIAGHVVFALFNQHLYFQGNMVNILLMSVLYTIVLASPFSFIVYSLRGRIKKNWGNLFPYLFYLTAMLTAVFQLQSYNINLSNFFFLPIILLPYFIYALCFGYIRVNFGFLHAVTIGIVLNLIPYSAFFLK